MRTSLFSTKHVAILIAVGLLSFIAAVVLAVFVGKNEAYAVNDSYGISAVDQRALFELLEELEIPVTRRRSEARAIDGGVLIAADPLTDSAALERFDRLLRLETTVLLVLPKWRAGPPFSDPDWIGPADFVPEEPIQAVLDRMGITGELVRLEESVPVEEWEGGPLRVSPELESPQLLLSSGVNPLIACEDGFLFGEVITQDAELYVLTDPDLFANHGIGRGRNAVFAIDLLNSLRGDGPVIFDEVVHGLPEIDNFWSELLSFPLVLLVLQALLTAGLAAWAGSVRFGAPLVAKPEWRIGKEHLITNTAELLLEGGYSASMLRRYFHAMQRSVLSALKAPSDLDTKARWTWLIRMTGMKNVSLDLEAMQDKVATLSKSGRRAWSNPPRKVVAAASEIHDWHEEMVNGSRHDSRNG